MEVATVRQLRALVRGRRKDLCLTQAALAQLAGVSRQWVVSFERGTSVSTELPLVLRVLATLGLGVDVAVRETVRELDAGSTDAGSDVDLDELLEGYATS